MDFKLLTALVLMSSFLLKGNDANVINNIDQPESEKIPKFEEIEKSEVELEEPTDAKRSLVRPGQSKKKSFGDISLELAKLYLLEETSRKRKSITNLQNEVNEHSADKCSRIKKVGEPIVHHHSGYSKGAWMRDPLGILGPEKIWYINGAYGKKVLEFNSMDQFKAGEIAKTHYLPYYIDGTGSVVYGRYLYFNRASSKYIMQYDLVKKRLKKQYYLSSYIRPRSYYYSSSSYNTMDFSVDESGLWVLYSKKYQSGKLCATQIDTQRLTGIQTYCGISSETMRSMGNAFVACGVVYSIDSYSSKTTTINYAYDTTARSGASEGIKFVNKFGYNSMVTYNPREKVLYAWDNNRQITYPLEFEDNTN